MQKILTGKEKGKKVRRNQLIVGFILIGLMVLSTAGYAISNGDKSSTSSGSQQINYNGIQFVQSSSYWTFSKGGSDFSTRYNPQETQGLLVTTDFNLNTYSGKALYVVGDTSDAIYEVSRNFNSLVLRMQQACLDEKNCKDNFPVKDCKTDNIIVMREPLANESESVYKTNNCAFIVAEGLNQTRYADAFIFKTLGI